MLPQGIYYYGGDYVWMHLGTRIRFVVHSLNLQLVWKCIAPITEGYMIMVNVGGSKRASLCVVMSAK